MTPDELAAIVEAERDLYRAVDTDEDFVDYDDDYDDESCQTCGGDGFEWCEDQNSSEGCWEADCTGYSHTCPNCHGSGRAKDQWFW